MGFPYASFLLGQVDSTLMNPPEQTKIGRHALDFYAQDSWKITRTLTLDYGLRYDFQTYVSEQYGRMPSFSATTPNSQFNNIPGSHNLRRLGTGTLQLSVCQELPTCLWAPGRSRVPDHPQDGPPRRLRRRLWIYRTRQPHPKRRGDRKLPVGVRSAGFDQSVMTLANGIPLKPVWPSTSQSLFPSLSAVNIVGRNSGRPARQSQWSIGIQREITHDTLIEASYVGNVGVWWVANGLVNYNAINPATLARRA